MKKPMLSQNNTVKNYSEESPKPAVFIAIAAVVLIAAPLTMANKKISEAGEKSADVSVYAKLAEKLEGNVAVVKSIVKQGVVAEKALPGKRITTITPDDAKLPEADPSEVSSLSAFNISGIYYHPRDPIVTIDGENYHKGAVVKGYKILDIRQTTVKFRDPTGGIIETNIYGDLLQ